ncbi:MAG: hypothetical protein NPIRA06_20060 [Nitrospirales bacterium]|nr:MAG: hypothetical protein NPIRA06_20060 [Nitrospirales bacterium]
MKANPAPEIIQLLATLGSRFDIASRYELDLCLSLGVPATWLSYGNTVKKEVDIAYAFACGVRLFAFDSVAELEKLGRQAPGVGLQFRVLSQGQTRIGLFLENSVVTWPWRMNYSSNVVISG